MQGVSTMTPKDSVSSDSESDRPPLQDLKTEKENSSKHLDAVEKETLDADQGKTEDEAESKTDEKGKEHSDNDSKDHSDTKKPEQTYPGFPYPHHQPHPYPYPYPYPYGQQQPYPQAQYQEAIYQNVTDPDQAYYMQYYGQQSTLATPTPGMMYEQRRSYNQMSAYFDTSKFPLGGAPAQPNPVPQKKVTKADIERFKKRKEEKKRLKNKWLFE